MEPGGSKITKPRRVRKAPYRKWSNGEQQQLIMFMRDNRPLEKSTAQVYFESFLESHQLQMDWSLVRLKARHLRQCYTKARNWQNSTGAGAMQEGETTESIVSKICFFFSDLEDIFGYKEFESNASVLDTEENAVPPIDDNAENIQTLNVQVVCTESSSPSTADIFDAGSSSTTAANVAATPEVANGFHEIGMPPASTYSTINRRKGIYSRTGRADVLSMHSGLVQVKQQKLEMESKMKDKELALKEKELHLQVQKFLFEKEKTKSDEKIKILEIEMKEKVALKELEMKERIVMEELTLLLC